MNRTFNYDLAFSRNIGWVTETEQTLLRDKKIAIAGLGGVGGSHLITLTRLGIGKFHISDLDIFELANFNRQAGASISHLEKPKVEVMKQLALDINPELEISTFPAGVHDENIDAFLDGVDLYVDGLDFFALTARRIVFAACAERNIPAITAAPLGMGVSFLCFMPGKMTFEEYFQWEGQTETEQLLRFLVGLSPTALQMTYLADDSRLDIANHKGPSTPMACDLCAGMVGTYALKILLNRGEIVAAPKAVHFDAYKNKCVITWRPGGNSNPLQQLGLLMLRRKIQAKLG
ncbi:ThiF family adenylyltransferase [Methylomonas methanica]|uniref:UBA/THIF-type NAD/FAD binding protein n=1 Tax=Methylomonas methanica (strain DSM 25384 / MC09) TaxID=857087 RepID=G0A4F8_METMM|nr:ThiF family adenylyltransferase [Methylomonas methanica]AEG01549.1 UBA/THIF-type NAD/FAD binding protein [Methylomonas methanica MC09]